MELRKISGRSYYIPGRVNLGVCIDNGKALLIDTGGDDTSGRHIFRLLEKEGYEIAGIINTHSNADHVGGNAYIRKKTGCRIMTTAIEGIITENPFLEPVLLWSAFPFKELRNKFLQADPSKVDIVIDSSGPIESTELEAVPLPGHFLDMIGIKSPDGVFYIADSLFSEEIIDKYHLVVTIDVGGALKTMDFLESSDEKYYVPCHAPATDDIVPLVRKNRENIFRISDEIEDICSVPSTRDDILGRMTKKYGIRMDATQYVLSLITISAHIAYLIDEDRLEYIVSDGRLLWKKK